MRAELCSLPNVAQVSIGGSAPGRKEMGSRAGGGHSSTPHRAALLERRGRKPDYLLGGDTGVWASSQGRRVSVSPSLEKGLRGLVPLGEHLPQRLRLQKRPPWRRHPLPTPAELPETGAGRSEGIRASPARLPSLRRLPGRAASLFLPAPPRAKLRDASGTKFRDAAINSRPWSSAAIFSSPRAIITFCCRCPGWLALPPPAQGGAGNGSRRPAVSSRGDEGRRPQAGREGHLRWAAAEAARAPGQAAGIWLRGSLEGGESLRTLCPCSPWPSPE